MESSRTPLHRLLRPRSVAVIGGNDAAEVIRQCRRSGFEGALWAVSATRSELAGVACVPRVADLPQAPDAAFVAVPRDQAIGVVGDLARLGAGGAVCYASGFAEVGDEGAALQARLLEAAGSMALLGPNCYGLLNHLDGTALWPDRAGGRRVDRGVAILTQSGNIGLNLSMQRHHLPVAYVISLGNMAQIGFHQLADALLDDPRVSAIGLHIEGLGDAAAFSEVALRALRQGVPMVALKTGASALGAQLAASHTSALASQDTLVEALFERVGVARVDDLPSLLETLKLMHVCGPRLIESASRSPLRLGSLSCSGGEASLVADLGEKAGLQFPRLPDDVRARLRHTLGPHVPVSNPLDYHTYIWADVPALTRCFAALRHAPIDASMLVLDFPNVAADGSDTTGELAPGWEESLTAYLDAADVGASPALLVSSLSELMPDTAAQRALSRGVAPMQGLMDCMQALAAVAHIGRRRAQSAEARPLELPGDWPAGLSMSLNEAEAKRLLAGAGVPVPAHRLVASAEEVAQAAEAIGWPVAVKIVSSTLSHKSEAGAVALNLRTAGDVRRTVVDMHYRHPTASQWLIEAMVQGTVAELLVGITRDPQFGLALTLGSGGVLVELLADTRTLLWPVSPADIQHALCALRCAPLLAGHRGRPAAHLPSLVEAIVSATRLADQHADTLLELEINPLIATPHGAFAVDALMRVAAPTPLP